MADGYGETLKQLHLTIAQINEPKTGTIYKVDSLHKKQLYK